MATVMTRLVAAGFTSELAHLVARQSAAIGPSAVELGPGLTLILTPIGDGNG